MFDSEQRLGALPIPSPDSLTAKLSGDRDSIQELNGGDTMPIHELKKRAENLESRISQTGYPERLRLQPEFSKVLARLRAEGARVPTHLSNLDEILTDEAIEAQFDNMPV